MSGVSEIWKPITGYPAYEVSNLGRVCSLDRTVSFIAGGRKKTAFLRGKVLKITVGSHGYGQISLSDGGERYEACVHVLVAEAFVGPRPDGLNVLHHDGDRSNCLPGNLYYGDQADNGADAKRHGATPAGERNGQAKLTAGEVRAIRRARGGYRAIGARFGISPSNVGFIRRGETWVGVA